MHWKHHAARLADEVCGPGSRWHEAVAQTPRHVLLPRWWDAAPFGPWLSYDGPCDTDAWMAHVYADRAVVTEVDGKHADDAGVEAMPAHARPTSSSSMPSRVISMLRHGRLAEGCDVLIAGSGSGYSTALASHLLGTRHVTGIDVSDYVTTKAAARLAPLGIMPDFRVADATKELPGTYDRIVSMMSLRSVPASWLTGLRERGRFVTALAGTQMVLTASRTATGKYAATGRIEWEPAGFMRARGDAVPGSVRDTADELADGDTTAGRYPVVNVRGSRELSAMMAISVPGIEHDYQQDSDGGRTAWMLAPDGSWARVSARDGRETPTVTQGGPLRLWDILDGHRDDWLSRGSFPVYGAQAFVRPDGTIRLQRGDWSAEIG